MDKVSMSEPVLVGHCAWEWPSRTQDSSTPQGSQGFSARFPLVFPLLFPQGFPSFSSFHGFFETVPMSPGVTQVFHSVAQRFPLSFSQSSQRFPTQGLPKIGVPLNHPFIEGYSIKNNPTIGVPPFMEPLKSQSKTHQIPFKAY